jgi:riboflavin synthase
MFTGIVEAVGKIVGLEPRREVTRIRVLAPGVAEGVRLGDSIAVNGACLTVTENDASHVAFDAVQETLDRTSLGSLAVGSAVNLERAMRADGRLDGHIVQGHVDDTGTVRALRRAGEDVRLEISAAAEFTELLVEKGSVAIDGVSLTVVGVTETGFDVALIPHTLEVTTLGAIRSGDPVNLEADVLGKYVKRYLERVLPAAAGNAQR